MHFDTLFVSHLLFTVYKKSHKYLIFLLQIRSHTLNKTIIILFQIVRESFQSLYTLEDLFLNRMPDLVAIDGHALIDNTKLKSLSLENNEKLRPLPWGVFATNGLLQDVSFRNNTW